MRFKKLLPRLGLIVGFLALLISMKFQNEIKDTASFFLEKIQISFDNFFYFSGSNPKRHRPLSTLTKETELTLYIGTPFRDFKRSDWNWFWDLIYGAFPKEKPDKEGLPLKLRQLDSDEIALKLIKRYPEVFANFKENHWRMFFYEILKFKE